jgi:DNA-damage-inducible protein D
MDAHIFEKLKKLNDHHQEYWSARDLAKVLEYSEYRFFLPVLEKAKTACKQSYQEVNDHFVDVHDMVELGS